MITYLFTSFRFQAGVNSTQGTHSESIKIQHSTKANNQIGKENKLYRNIKMQCDCNLNQYPLARVQIKRMYM